MTALRAWLLVLSSGFSLHLAAAPMQLTLSGPPGAVRGGTAIHDTGFTVRYGSEHSSLPVNLLVARPGQRVDFAVQPPVPSVMHMDAGGGVLEARGAHAWRWTAPGRHGRYTLEITAANGRVMRFYAFVTVPRERAARGLLNGYRIGAYPREPLRGLAAYQPPQGFIEVTPEIAGTPISPRLRLGQFLCKQGGRFPQYLVLRERLPLLIEAMLDRFDAAGLPADGLHVMSGYRTPEYNRAIGNGPYSRHQWGDAADVYLDADGDGRMDDLDGNGRSDIGDARLLYRVLETAAREPNWTPYTGGLSAYPPTPAHGPFLHVDARGHPARW